LAAHLFPQPRVAQGLALRRRRLASAAIDLSDGLSTDLAHLCEESGTHAVIEKGAVPIATGASIEQALHGGEDYELLFAARPSIRVPRSIAGVSITRIGHIIRKDRKKPLVSINTGASLETLERRGWQHFDF
jgi:thiamine-monophosphate kinase